MDRAVILYQVSHTKKNSNNTKSKIVIEEYIQSIINIGKY